MKYILYYIICGMTITGFFSSCISSEETNYLQAIDKAYILESYKEYRLAKEDIITCMILTGDKEFLETFNTLLTQNGQAVKLFTIYDDGTIVLPYFGPIKIAGHTIQEAEEIIQKAMQESIIDAQVKISLASNIFYVLSNGKQGSYSVYKENMSIYQALAISGQTTESMDLSKVSIVRKDVNGNSIVKTFDLRTQDVIQSEFYYIQPNDVIYFPTNRNAFFNITSLNSFVATIMVPLTFLVFAATYNF
ncbi:polysaccharide biosynthesis/export family protein [Dysgonomonas sp. ZJ709]|nr:polysaccharide biosynthesis/export family protein [Dysgonomonas sp. ZJ709]